MIPAYPSETVYPHLEWTTSGLVGTIGVRITRDSDGATVLARQTTGITEFLTSAEYVAAVVAPAAQGSYTVRWDDGSTSVGHVASEVLVVSYDPPGTAALPAPGDLCTVAAVKEAIETSTTASDSMIQSFITRASAEIERRYQRYFCDHGSEIHFFQIIDDLCDLSPYDLRTPTTVTLRNPDQTNTLVLTQFQDYVMRPAGGWAGLGTYTRLLMSKNIVTAGYMINFNQAEILVDGLWGTTTTPPDIIDGAVTTVASWLDRAFAEYGQTFVQSDGRQLRPDRFAGWRIPASAHGIFSEYDRRPASYTL